MAVAQPPRGRLARLLWLSVAAAVATIGLKTVAWALTGSVGLLSDAAESVVNLVAALFALWAVTYAAQPPDEDHAYGHDKADYLSAGAEGVMILVAAIVILVTAVERLLNPQPIDDATAGVVVSLAASVLNLVVGRVLVRDGKRYRSLTVEADGKHLLTDVWTSVGVAAGVTLVVLTGVDALDAVIALAVGVNVIVTGVGLIRRSLDGFLDRALEADELARCEEIFDAYRAQGIEFHALRTRRAGRRAFASVHVLVPGQWTVTRGHELLEDIEAQLRAALEPATIFTHLEPREDPASFADMTLDRSEGEPA